MTNGVRTAIESADVDALRALVAADPVCAHANVCWGEGGKNVVPPLHFVCDAVFLGLANQEESLALANVLLEAGVEPDLAYTKSGDTFLITAASLGAERVGRRLVELGADVTRRGLFGATALHWAAMMGLGGLARSLVEQGAELEVEDTEYRCTPLAWALYGWSEGTNGNRDGIPGVAQVLTGIGASIPPDTLGKLSKDSDKALRDALSR